jgi:hypothetical protein
MSRDLPAMPNLEYLKKQAKKRLHELQQGSPDTKLADAQHAIAKEYGFTSWEHLRTQVVSGRGGGGGTTVAVDALPDFEFQRYTPRARQALFFSRYEAAQLGSVRIEPQHILLGVIRAGYTLMRPIFEPADLSLEGARAEVVSGNDLRGVSPLPSSVEVPFSNETKQILLSAVEEAGRLSHRDIGMSHMLLGILRDERSVAASVLNRRGLHRDAIQKAAVSLAGEDRQP